MEGYYWIESSRFECDLPSSDGSFERSDLMHYPHRLSRIKRKRKCGFRARMRTANGRKILNRKRRRGRRASVC